ncbi:MAG: hypothetical protein ACKOB3_04975 [Holophagaceae bacterium]
MSNLTLFPFRPMASWGYISIALMTATAYSYASAGSFKLINVLGSLSEGLLFSVVIVWAFRKYVITAKIPS